MRSKSFLFGGLCLHLVNLSFKFFGVGEVVIAQNFEVLVKFINERDSSWNIQLHNIFVRINVPFSEIPLRALTIALIEFPWATTSALLPDLTSGTIVFSQYGMTLSIVVFKLWVNNYLPQSREVLQVSNLHICDQIWDVFRHPRSKLEEGCRNFFSKFALVLFRVFKQSQVCLNLARHHSVFH